MTEQQIPAEVRLAQYREQATWSNATHGSGAEKALHEIASELQAEVQRLRKEHRGCDRSLDEVMRERDYAQDMADKLAAAIAPEDVLGEHSDGNFPWQNALDWAVEKERTFAEQQAELDRLRDLITRAQNAVDSGDLDAVRAALSGPVPVAPLPEAELVDDAAVVPAAGEPQ